MMSKPAVVTGDSDSGAFQDPVTINTTCITCDKRRQTEVEDKCKMETHFLTPGQIDEVELAGKFMSGLRVFLLDVNEEDAMTPGTVLIHV